MTKKNYRINGIDCASCASLIELDLEDAGFKCSCSYIKQTLEVEFEEIIDEVKLKNLVKKAGYDIS